MCITLRHEAYHRPGTFDFDNVQHLDDSDLYSDALQRNSATSIQSRRSATYIGRRHSVSLAVQNYFDRVHLFSLRIGIFSTERGMGQFISAAAFKLRQTFSTSTDFIRIGSRVFIFDRRQ